MRQSRGKPNTSTGVHVQGTCNDYRNNANVAEWSRVGSSGPKRRGTANDCT